MNHGFTSAFVLFLLVLDPFGSLPIFIAVMQKVPSHRRVRVAFRESLIAFFVLTAFIFWGQNFLNLMHLSERSLEVAGGVILLIISLKMVLSDRETPHEFGRQREPFIVPIAVPLLAGPSAMATVLISVTRQPDQLWLWMAALAAAIGVSGGVLLISDKIQQWVGISTVLAVEKLMGLVLSAISVEMILAGLKNYFFNS